jgi:hypothetical protein
MVAAKKRAARVSETSEDLFDQVDVPAAVVCAQCGDAECPGCASELSRSGVMAIVAWERPGAPFFTRLWSTARAATFDSDRFFESLPDGPVSPALRFAIVSELFAATAMVLAVFVPLAAAAPMWLKHLVLDEGAVVGKLAVLGVPSLAMLLVAAHAAHGWALDRGARRLGVRPAPARALRFGLYAAGWDLVIGPLGAIVVAIKEGISASLRVGTVAMGLPTRSARAFLRGCYHLDGKSAEPALRASYVAAVIATILGAMAVIAAGVVVMLL